MTQLLCVAMVLSGMAALVFESLWFRLAGLALGNSVWSSSVVLAGYMGGLACGSLLALRLGPRLKRPLQAYAAMEIVIGMSGAALVIGLPGLSAALAPLLSQAASGTWMLNAARLGVAFVLMLVPTTAMGLTLPLVTAALGGDSRRYGWALGHLYGWNTLGGVAGALLGEMAFVHWFGVRFSGLLAMALNLGAASLALQLARSQRWPAVPQPAERAADARGQRPAGRRLLLAAAALAGCLLLALEVVWFRLLLLFVFGSALQFAVMLAMVLVGIGLGGVAAGMILGRKPDAHLHVPLVALAAGLATLVSYWRFDPQASPIFTLAGTLSAALQLMIATSLCSGALFAWIGAAMRPHLQSNAAATGALTLANTAGAMVGSAGAALVVLPQLGVERSILAIGICYLVLAWVCFWAVKGAGARARQQLLTLSAASLAFVALVALFPQGLMQRHFVRQAFKTFTDRSVRVLAVREGLSETVVLLETDWRGQALHYRLATNANSMSTTQFAAKRYMKLFAYWPLAVNSDLKRALLICYGLGNTAAALNSSPGVERVDIVDTSSDVLAVSPLVYAEAASVPLNDPRVKVHIEDGRFFLQTTRETYDLITGEPPPPGVAGIVNLYSREYFKLMRQRLRPGGLVTYWLPVRMMRVEESQAIVRAFCDVFEDCTLWNTAPLDWMLAGSRGRQTETSAETFADLWRNPGTAGELRSIGIETPEQMGALFLGDRTTLLDFAGKTPALTDDWPQRIGSRGATSSDASAMLASYGALEDAEAASRRFAASEWVARVWPAALRESSRVAFRSQGIFNHIGHRELRYVLLYEALTGSGFENLPALVLGIAPERRALARRVAAGAPLDAELAYVLAADACARRDYAEADRLLLAAATAFPGDADTRLERAVVLLASGRREEARSALAALGAMRLDADQQRQRGWLAARLTEGAR